MEDWEERFWDKVNIRGPEDCWEWQASISHRGYGTFRKHKGGTHRNAHRFAYEIEHGHQPEQNVLHKCDNRSCVNPNHIYPGSQSENVKDAFERGDATQLGEDNSCASLTEEDVREIKKKLMNSSKSHGEIAENYPVQRQAISKISCGARWSHVEVNQ